MGLSFGAFDAGFQLMNILFPIVFISIFCIFIVTFVRTISAGAKQKRKNDASPRVTAEAKVVSKRMQVGQNYQHHHHADGTMHSYDYNYSKYFATFEFDSGDRLELPVDGSDYGLLVEGDQGKLTFQGTRYLGFARS